MAVGYSTPARNGPADPRAPGVACADVWASTRWFADLTVLSSLGSSRNTMGSFTLDAPHRRSDRRWRFAPTLQPSSSE